MALFKRTYSGLITGGLGLGACCGLLTMGFHLFKCKIEIIPPKPPPNIGGGGPYVANGFYIPTYKQITSTTKFVLITVTIQDKTWKKSYVVDRIKGRIIVKIVNILNSVKNSITITINKIARIKHQIITTIKNRNIL